MPTKQSSKTDEDSVELDLLDNPTTSYPPRMASRPYSEFVQKYGQFLSWGGFFAFFVVFLVLQIVLINTVSRINSGLNNTLDQGEQPDPPPAIDECAAFDTEQFYTPFSSQQIKKNLVFGSPSTPRVILLRNATILTGLRETLSRHDVLVVEGMIASVQLTPLTTSESIDLTIDLSGKYLTPGLIDMHSHLLVDSYPSDANANFDDNEMTDPRTPFVRSLDSMNLNDVALELVRDGGGVTTTLILPGSGNIMGGEAYVIKLKGKTAERTLMPGLAKRYFKMACGENPKGVYGPQGEMPMTRMGSAWLMREAFFRAAELLNAQKKWDCQFAADPANVNERRPEDLELEPLVSILTGDALLNVHCYKTEDMEMVLRLKNEFNFSIAAFHHAHEAYKIADLLKANNIGAAIFSELGLYKIEAYSASTHSPQLLQDAGVPWVFVSDHPVTNSRNLIQQGRRTLNYNPQLDVHTVLSAITSVPAQLLGVFDRVGSISEGKEADIVAWNGPPFEIGSLPELVLIDGEVMYNTPKPFRQVPSPTVGSNPGSNLQCAQENSELPGLVLQNVNIYTMNELDQDVQNGVIVVRNGTITCVASNLASCSSATAGLPVFDLRGAVVTPGLLSLDSTISQLEVDQEENSADGSLDGVSPFEASQIRAVDGIHFHMFQSKKLKTLISSGITTHLASGIGSNLINGVGAMHWTCGTDLDWAIISPQSSVHSTVGAFARNGGASQTISGQWSVLRSLFSKNAQTAPFSQVLNGSIPLVFHMNQADHISSALRFADELNIPKTVIVGAAEAHLVTAALKRFSRQIGLVLSPLQPQGDYFETWNSRYDNLEALKTALSGKENILISFAEPEPTLVRLLRWKAGIAQQQMDLDFKEALSLLTKNPAKMFGVYAQGVGQIVEGSVANLVAWSASPFTYKSKVLATVVKDHFICLPPVDF